MDEAASQLYVSHGNAINVLVVTTTFTVLENFPTQKGARTITLNQKNHKIYLPTAEYNSAPEVTAQNLKPRVTVKSGTFSVLEIGL
ncbi:MAG: hypothetical protein WCK78_06080 [Paludibacter sp.]